MSCKMMTKYEIKTTNNRDKTKGQTNSMIIRADDFT
jgi:hypothetical protein